MYVYVCSIQTFKERRSRCHYPQIYSCFGNRKNNIAAPNKRLRNFRDTYIHTHTYTCMYACVLGSMHVFLLHESLAINLHKVRATVSKDIHTHMQMQSHMYVLRVHIHTYICTHILM